MAQQNPTDSRPAPTAEEIEKGKIMAILGYLVCFILPLLAARENKFAMYHQEQIFMVFIVYIIGWVLSFVLIGFPILLFALVLWVLGLVKAAQGKWDPLPLVGNWATKFNLVK